MGMATSLGFMDRYFAMIRHASWNGGVSGWYVCDGRNLDKINLARPIHDEPCASEQEAREIAAMMNDEEGDEFGSSSGRRKGAAKA